MNTKKKRFITTMFMTLFVSVLFVSAQTIDVIIRTKYIFDKKIPSIIDIEQKDNFDVKEKIDGKSYLEQLLQLNKETTAVLVDTYTDSIGGFHEVYKEYYKGIEVDGSKYALHYNKDGYIYRASGCFWTIESLNTKARLSEKEALQSSMKEIGAEKYAWEDVRSEQFIKDISKNNKATYYPTGKLFVHIKEDAPYLTYQFNINAVKPELHYNVFVDASSGKIVDKYSTVCEITTTANTNYSGNNKTIETLYDSNEAAYILKDNTRAEYILTMKNSHDHYTSANNSWSGLSNYDRNAIDVHWGTEKVYDFYVNKFNRQSFDGNGQYVFSQVNQTSINNAQYVWENNQNSHFDYGFKNGNTSYPLVSLDIIAHEFTHGVTKYTSGLVYSAESGAINEGMSDILAVYAERWAKPLKSDADIWKLGEDVYELRNLANPNCKYYNGSNWEYPYENYDNGWVHNNSGVFSYWAYLLTHGGTNNVPNIIVPVSVTAIELEKVMNICYRTNVNKLSSYSNFASLAEYTCESAAELYNSYIVNQVLNAWYNVGVIPLNEIMSLEGPTICNNSTYYINNLPSECSVTWSLSDGKYSSPVYFHENSPSSNNCTITVNPEVSMNGAILTATVWYNGAILTTYTKTIHTGFLGTYTNNGSTRKLDLPRTIYVMPNSTLIINSDRLKGASLSYSGSIPTSKSFNSSDGVLRVDVPSSGSFVIHVQCSNGDSYDIPFEISMIINSLGIQVYSGMINVSVIQEIDPAYAENKSIQSEEILNNATSWLLEIYNAITGQKVYTQEETGTTCNVETNGWKEGIYVVRAKIGDEVISEKVTIK